MSFRSISMCFVTFAVSIGLMTAGCGGGSSPTKPVQPPTPPTPPPPPPTVSTVVVSPNAASLEVGATQNFTATARTSGGAVVSGVNFTWLSSNTAVVTINNNGVATAVAPGTATIKATGNGVSSTAVTVTVTQAPVASVTVSPSAAQQMTVGDMQTFRAMARTSRGAVRDDVTISWSSSDTGVVTITSAGVATAVAVGTATIRASAEGVNSSPVMITVVEPPPMVASVVVTPAEASIEVGMAQQFEAMAMTDDGMMISDVAITWSSSDEMVATVDSTGLATGVGAGEVAIMATADEISGTAMLTVTEPPPLVVASVSVTPEMAEIVEGGMQQFEAMAMTDDGMMISGVQFDWSSSDDGVATVDDTGLAAGVIAGEVTITATVDGVSGTAMLTVIVPPPPVVATVSVSPEMASIEEGQMQQFEAMAMTEDGLAIPDVEFTWESSDEMVATVDVDGLATGIIAGQVMITATADDISGTAMLTVMAPPPEVASVTVSPTMAEIEAGQTQKFIALAADADGMLISDALITWESSDEAVATVDDTGLATGVSEGQVTITATSDDVSGTAALTVIEPPPVLARIEVSPAMFSIEEGDRKRFSAMGFASDNEEITDLDFTWSSSDTNVATVDETGLATGVSAGTASIRAMAEGITGAASLTVNAPPPASRSGMFGGVSGYQAGGTAILEETGMGGLVLRFGSDFRMNASGFDVILYTEPRIKLRGSNAARPGTFVNLGEMKSRTGAQTYPVPSNVELDTYNFVIIFCHPFNITVGVAQLE